MISAANTIKNWLNEIVNSFKNERYNNGFTEANNNTITKIKIEHMDIKILNFLD